MNQQCKCFIQVYYVFNSRSIVDYKSKVTINYQTRPDHTCASFLPITAETFNLYIRHKHTKKKTDLWRSTHRAVSFSHRSLATFACFHTERLTFKIRRRGDTSAQLRRGQVWIKA